MASATSRSLSLTGVDAGNYTVNATASDDAVISAKALTGSITVAASKTYDGTKAATVTGSALPGVIAPDAVTLVVGAATFDSEDVGTRTATAGLSLTGADAGNYTVNATASDDAVISAKALTGSITVADKTYDGTKAATVTGSSLPGVIAPDAVTLVVGAATFDSEDVGTRTATAGLSLTGADAGNYTVNATASDDAVISAKALTGSITVADKTYDGTTTATVTGSSLPGVIAPDVVTLVVAAATFDSEDVGTRTATAGLSLTGADAGNYTVNATASDDAVISAKALTPVIVANDKMYDGTTTATLSSQTMTGVIGGETVTLIVGAANFDTKEVGTNKTVTASDLSLGGADAGNYVLGATTATDLADIRAVGLTLAGNVDMAGRITFAVFNASPGALVDVVLGLKEGQGWVRVRKQKPVELRIEAPKVVAQAVADKDGQAVAILDLINYADQTIYLQAFEQKPKRQISNLMKIDVPPLPTLKIDDVAVNEGDGLAKFKVTLSPASDREVRVKYATANGTAKAGKDYTAKRGTLKIPAGTSVVEISVPIKNDTTREDAESFFVNLSKAKNATLEDNQATGTIQDNDGGLPLRLAAVPGRQNAAGTLTADQLAAVTDEAIRRWTLAVGDQAAASLSGVNWELADLSGNLLGLTSGHTMRIDRDAAGRGWFVDWSPWDDDEFWRARATDELPARRGGPADERADLLSAVMHELGHVLGLLGLARRQRRPDGRFPGARPAAGALTRITQVSGDSLSVRFVRPVHHPRANAPRLTNNQGSSLSGRGNGDSSRRRVKRRPK